MDIYPIVIIYNNSCAESETCLSLIQQSAPLNTVVLFDNSDRDYGNRSFCEKQGWTYLGGEGNLGLSRAYNKAVAYLRETKHRGFVCILDDDTELEQNFFRDLIAWIERSDRKIIVPILRCGGRIVSPWQDNADGNNRFFRSVEECMTMLPENVLAFNSCMTIDMDVFEKLSYDEDLFLDGVDYAFLLSARHQGIPLGVCPLVCLQSFSGMSAASREDELRRFRIYAKDFAVLADKYKINYWKTVGRRALHLCLRHRSAEFLVAYLKNIHKD